MDQETRFDTFYKNRSRLAFGQSLPLELRIAVGAIRPPKHVLDLGCGDGRITLSLADMGYRVTGVDVSSVGLAKLQSIAEEHGVDRQLTLIHGDIRSIALPEQAFDMVIAETVFDHLPASDVDSAFEATVKALKPGGILYAKVHTVDDPGNTGKAEASELQEAIRYYFPRKKLLHMTTDAFNILSYRENMCVDHTHGAPHQHAFSWLLARKRNDAIVAIPHTIN